MVLVQNDFLQIDFDETSKFLMVSPKNQTPVTSLHYRNSLQNILNLLSAHQVKFWLFDARINTPIQSEDQAWTMHLIEEYAALINLEKLALVLPRNIHNVMAAESISQQVQCLISTEIQFFSDPEEACEWLEESFRELCFLDETIELEYNHLHHWLYANWKGNHNLASVRRGCEFILDLMAAKNCGKLLNDNRFALGSWDDATEWIVMDWVPRMEAQGLHATAWILSPSTMNRISSQKVLDQVQLRSQLQIFNNLYAARNWLQIASVGS